MHAEVFCGLPDDAARLRREIFMDEQGFENEFDDVDERAAHIVLYEGREPLATCRYYRADDGRYFIGRVAVSRACRGMALGAALMREAETRIAAHGGEETFVSAQVRVRGFYEKQGYAAVGSEYADEGCLHILMRKVLTER